MTVEMPVTHVIFDMDGLILDTEPLYTKATSNCTQRYGKEFSIELKRKMMGRPGLDAAKILLDELKIPLTIEEWMKLINEEYYKVFKGHVPLMPGAERLIRHLHAKSVPIAVATSSRKFTFDLKTQNYLDLFALFDHIVIAPDDPEIAHGKPDPSTFLVCAKRFKNPPKSNAECLVFEDSLAGIEAARRARMKSVWVPDSRWGTSKDPAKATLVLNSLEQFKPEQFGLPPFDV